MKNLLANRGVLATAWFVVVALVAGLGILAFLQPPPTPSSEPVTVSLAPAPEAPMAPEAASPGGSEAAMAPEPDGMPQGSGEAAAPAHAEGEAVQAALPPVPEAAPDKATEDHPAAGQEGAAPAQPAHAAEETAPTPAQETPEKPASKPETKPAADQHATAPATSDASHGEPTKDKAAHGGEAAQGETAHGAPEAPAQEALLTIPAVPPSPEQLPQWERYRQPFNMDDKRPRIAVVLTGLGLSDSASDAAINQLPPAVTLSFSPYARGLERWIALARARGHEVMLDLPMEPTTFPNEDPGPQALLTSLTPEDNLNRLDWVLSRGSAFVGVAGAMGSRFTASRASAEPVLQEIKKRGLMFLDRRTTEDSVVPKLAEELDLPFAVNNRSVDERQASRVAIDARLAQIERIALTDGFAVAMAQPYPVTLERLAEWTTELSSRGFAIAPISALANRQKLP